MEPEKEDVNPEKDIYLNCSECASEFYWRVSDQIFYKSKNYQQPKRCWNCRQKRKQNAVIGYDVNSTTSAKKPDQGI